MISEERVQTLGAFSNECRKLHGQTLYEAHLDRPRSTLPPTALMKT